MEKKYLVACFLDVKGTYDNVSWTVLKESMKKLDIPEKMINLIFNIISSREFFVKFYDSVDGPRITSRILSPLLYTICTNTLETTIDSPYSILQYANERYDRRAESEFIVCIRLDGVE